MYNSKKASNNNCLSLIRILAAIQVMFGHLVEHLELPGNETLLHMTYYLRGVPIFFVISGLCIWFSIERSNTYLQYLRKRFWRIYPELWVAVIVELIVIIILYKGWNIKDMLLFAFSQSTIFQFWTPDSLKGYGVGTPNGALWTIGVMIQFYLVAYFFYKLMKNRKNIVWIIGFILSFVMSFAGTYITHNLINNELIEKLYGQTIIDYFWLFYMGMFIARFLDKIIPFLKKFWYIFLIIGFLFFITEWDLYSGYYLFWSIFLTSGLIGFAYRFPQFSISPDISYGLFLYHMIIANIFVEFNLVGKWFYALLVALIAILLALISSITIGRLSVKQKTKMKQ